MKNFIYEKEDFYKKQCERSNYNYYKKNFDSLNFGFSSLHEEIQKKIIETFISFKISNDCGKIFSEIFSNENIFLLEQYTRYIEKIIEDTSKYNHFSIEHSFFAKISEDCSYNFDSHSYYFEYIITSENNYLEIFKNVKDGTASLSSLYIKMLDLKKLNENLKFKTPLKNSFYFNTRTIEKIFFFLYSHLEYVITNIYLSSNVPIPIRSEILKYILKELNNLDKNIIFLKEKKKYFKFEFNLFYLFLQSKLITSKKVKTLESHLYKNEEKKFLNIENIKFAQNFENISFKDMNISNRKKDNEFTIKKEKIDKLIKILDEKIDGVIIPKDKTMYEMIYKIIYSKDNEIKNKKVFTILNNMLNLLEKDEESLSVEDNFYLEEYKAIFNSIIREQLFIEKGKYDEYKKFTEIMSYFISLFLKITNIEHLYNMNENLSILLSGYNNLFIHPDKLFRLAQYCTK